LNTESFLLSTACLTHSALVCYSLGILAYSAAKTFVTGFYALKEAATPVKIGALTVGINILLAVPAHGDLCAWRGWPWRHR